MCASSCFRCLRCRGRRRRWVRNGFKAKRYYVRHVRLLDIIYSRILRSLHQIRKLMK